MLFHVLDEELHSLRCSQRGADPLDHAPALVVGGPARPTIHHQAVRIQGGEVEPYRHVAGLQSESDAQGAQCTPPDLVDQGIVAEERQVTRTATRSDTGGDGHQHSQGAGAGQPVQIGR